MWYARLILTAALAFATPSIAQESRTTVGILTCTVAKPAEGGENMSCGFKSTGNAAEEKYVGVVHGLRIGEVSKEVLVWTVVGPAEGKPSAGFLAQEYARSKDPGHPPVWVGEKNPAIVLQFETHRSAETGSGVTKVELKLAGTSA